MNNLVLQVLIDIFHHSCIFSEYNKAEYKITYKIYKLKEY